MRHERSLWSAVCFVALGCWTASLVFSQEKSPVETQVAAPVLVVATNKIDQVVAHALYLMRSMNQPELGGLVSVMANQYSRGLDRNRPVGLTVSLNNKGNPDPALILPVKDLDAIFAGLAAFGEPEDLGDGLYTLDFAAQPFFMKKFGNWLVVARQEDIIAGYKQVPEVLIDKLGSQYTIGARLDIQSIPTALREQWLGLFRDSFTGSVNQQRIAIENRIERDASDTDKVEKLKLELAELNTRIEVLELQATEIENLVKQMNQMVVGIAIDQAGKQLILESATDFLPGSTFSERIKRSSTALTQYGNLPKQDAPIQIRSTDVLDPTQIPLYEESIRNLFESGVKTYLKENEIPIDDATLAEIESLALATLKEGVTDSSLSIHFDRDIHLVAGSHIADGEKLAAITQKLAKSLNVEKYQVTTKFDAYKVGDTTVHLVEVPLPEEAPKEVLDFFGGKVNVAIGTAPKSVYLTLGTNAEAELKAALGRSAGKNVQPGTPLDVSAKALPIIDFFRTINDSDIVLQAMQETGQAVAPNDSLTIKTRPIPNGMVVRMSLQEGLLKILGTMAKASSEERSGGF